MSGAFSAGSKPPKRSPNRRAMNKIAVRSMPISDWPEADSNGWYNACRPGSGLKRGGTASDLAAITRDDLARRYGYFLDFLERTGRLNRHAAAGTQVTPDNVRPTLQSCGRG
jgi:hypothetical protein